MRIMYTAVDNSTIVGQISNGNVNLCTSNVTDMSNLFHNNNSFNSNIGFWDTSNVVNMSEIFHNAYSFNQNIANWDTSNVTRLDYALPNHPLIRILASGMFHQ